MNKKLISFSLYGHDPAYQIGALENLALQKSVYPEWTCRFYVSQEIPDSIVRQLQAGGAEVVVKQTASGAGGMFWRFLPAGEANLNALIVRDVDSRLSLREKAAVDEWLASDRSFHIMRDHPNHGFLILGGMWGCRGGVLPQMACLISRWPYNTAFGHDQKFLATKIYPRIKDSCLIHSDLIGFEGEEVLPFPTNRVGTDFVGGTHRDPKMSAKEHDELCHARYKLMQMPASQTSYVPLTTKLRRRIRRQIEDIYCQWMWRCACEKKTNEPDSITLPARSRT